MPPPSKRRSQSRTVGRAAGRLFSKDVRQGSESSSDSDDEEMKIAAGANDTSMNFKDRATLADISDMFELCTKKSNVKFISVLLYMALRHFGITWRTCDSFLIEIGALSSQTCQKWTDIFLSSDYDQFCTDNRGGKRCEEFYDVFPELESAAKSFSAERCANKSADFTASDLASFVDRKYYDLTNTAKDNNANLIRSVQSCRLDLRRWGARFESNSKRPYFEGHERADVIRDRQSFVEYFLNRKDYYYTITEGESPSWTYPIKSQPSVLICE